MAVITISRESGSEADEMARRVDEPRHYPRLDASFLDLLTAASVTPVLTGRL